MPFINVATAWKELFMSPVDLNKTQPSRETSGLKMPEDISSISTAEAGQCESNSKGEKQQRNVSEAIRRARQNFLDAVKSVSNGGQVTKQRAVTREDESNLAIINTGKRSLSIPWKCSDTKIRQLAPQHTAAAGCEDVSCGKGDRLVKMAKRRLVAGVSDDVAAVVGRDLPTIRSAAWRGLPETRDAHPTGLSSLSNVISGSISPLKARWSSSAAAAATCTPPVTADMVTVRIQNGRVEVHRLPFDDVPDSATANESGREHIPNAECRQRMSEMTTRCAPGDGALGRKAAFPAKRPTTSAPRMPPKNVLTGYGLCEQENASSPFRVVAGNMDWSSDGEWSQRGLERVGTDGSDFMAAQNADLLLEAGAADVIFDALITLINE